MTAFELPERELLTTWDDSLLPDVIWSHSRRSVFEQCLKRYFFDYYARWIGNVADRERVRQRKKVQNRYLRSGTILHLILRTYFRKSKEGQLTTKDWAINWARRLFNDDVKYSASIRDGHAPREDPFGPELLSEILDRKESGESLLAETLDTLVESIVNFFDSSDLERFRRVGRRSNSLIEKPIRLKAVGYRAIGQIDLAVNQKDTAVVADWKMGGSPADGSDSLQLAFYGMWAVREFNRPVEDLRAFKVHLATNQIVSFSSDECILNNAAARIKHDS